MVKQRHYFDIGTKSRFMSSKTKIDPYCKNILDLTSIFRQVISEVKSKKEKLKSSQVNLFVF